MSHVEYCRYIIVSQYYFRPKPPLPNHLSIGDVLLPPTVTVRLNFLSIHLSSLVVGPKTAWVVEIMNNLITEENGLLKTRENIKWQIEKHHRDARKLSTVSMYTEVLKDSSRGQDMLESPPSPV